MATSGTLRLQPQRVPLGMLRLPNGTEVPVYITREWLGELQRIAGAAGQPATADSEDDLAPFNISQVSGHSLQSEPVPADMTAVLLSGLRAGDEGINVETLVFQLIARMNDLAAQVEALQQQPP